MINIALHNKHLSGHYHSNTIYEDQSHGRVLKFLDQVYHDTEYHSMLTKYMPELNLF